ncbi:TetR family transcriptional regulator [Haliea sp. E17]|uniref:TetR family transcriptional regulator n=1 Tax=Haliea sp. E17 TaxID=3401576 RepID=UPI003AAE998F
MKTTPVIRRRNALQTRARILSAAQEAFSRRSYSEVGIREIAALADVSPPMLIRYFGSKAGLFEAALIDAVRFEALPELGQEGLGKRFAQWFTDEELMLLPPAMIALSTGHEEASAITTRVAEEYAIKPLARWLGAPDGHLRALEIFMLSTSFVLYTQQLPVLQLSRAGKRKLADWFAESVQAIVDRGQGAAS